MNMNEMTYELRELKSCDMFPMFKILGKIGFKDLKDKLTAENVKDIMGMFNKQDEEGQEKNQDDMIAFVGFNIVAELVEGVLSHLPSCEQDIYSLLASLSGMKPKDVANLPMVTFTQMIIDVIKKEEFKDFFKVVSKLFN